MRAKRSLEEDVEVYDLDLNDFLAHHVNKRSAEPEPHRIYKPIR